jgi:hypothetical protein
MIPFNLFLNKKSTFESVLNLAEKCGIDSNDAVSPSNKILHALKRLEFDKYMERKLSYIVTDINYREFCETLKHGDIDKYIEQNIITFYCSGRYNRIIVDMLVTKLKEDCNNRKIIFLNINCDDYCLDRTEEGNYGCHGTCAMIVPKIGKGYDLYYMNPHGEVMKTYTYFEKVRTRTRCKKIVFDNIIDCIVIKKIVEYCNRKFDTQISYDYSNKHNYYGSNFQEKDNRGICFIFPTIAYYYFGKYFNHERVLEFNGKKKTVPSFKDLLLNGKFNLAIHSCFMDFNKKYKKCIFDTLDNDHDNEKIIEKLNKCLAKSNWNILKNITNTMVTFINQEYFANKRRYSICE